MKPENTSHSSIIVGSVEFDEFRKLVAVAAYYKAEKRHFVPGQELDDWLAAEQEISRQRRYWSQYIED